MGPNHSLQLLTCVSPEGRFVWGTHRPDYAAANLRVADHIQILGRTPDGRPVLNQSNFPGQDVGIPSADPVFEIPNAFPFRGATYITQSWAQEAARDPSRIAIPKRKAVSMHGCFGDLATAGAPLKTVAALIARLPETLQVALATTSTDPDDLQCLAELSCDFLREPATGRPSGLHFTLDSAGLSHAVIRNHRLFEAVANNPCLPDDYKECMVLRPGIQGGSEIIGEWHAGQSHAFEYLRCNSYIPWGHYAANMAHDAIRYDAGRLTLEDIRGLRHLYYQRTYVRLAEMLALARVPRRRPLSVRELEQLRRAVLEKTLEAEIRAAMPFSATLWGWNYGFDYAPSGFRLHASHQQIHQQHALIPTAVSYEAQGPGSRGPSYAYGDLVQLFGREFRRRTGRGFFDCLLQALRTNRRLDGRSSLPAELVIDEDEHVMLYVPKAQTSQWELQIMTLAPVGNILETDIEVRAALDRTLRLAMRILTGMGATMITVIEVSKRFNCDDADQRLVYSLLPRLPESPGAFSEAQLRWICGHFPEDFARACRAKLSQIGRD